MRKHLISHEDGQKCILFFGGGADDAVKVVRQSKPCDDRVQISLAGARYQMQRLMSMPICQKCFCSGKQGACMNARQEPFTVFCSQHLDTCFVWFPSEDVFVEMTEFLDSADAAVERLIARYLSRLLLCKGAVIHVQKQLGLEADRVENDAIEVQQDAVDLS